MHLTGPVDLAATLRGGQAFRWRPHEDCATFIGVVGDAIVAFAPSAHGAVEARAWPRRPRAFFERYLGIGEEVTARRARIAKDPVLAPAFAAYPGLRMLRQDPWETTVAFLTSANNNILRIEGILAALAATHGARLATPDGTSHALHTFPDARTLARVSEARLRAVGLGYRAPFLRETARIVARGDVDLDALRGRPLQEIREALTTLPGVGPKVADCIALFSLDAHDAFPIDRWILRAVSDAFFDGATLKPPEVEAFAAARWGQDAGLAQQFLFHAARLQARGATT